MNYAARARTRHPNPDRSEGKAPKQNALLCFVVYACLLVGVLGIPLTARTVDTPTDAIKDSDCGGSIEYSGTVIIQAMAMHLPAPCKLSVANTGTIYMQITVVEPAFKTVVFNVPKSPVTTPRWWTLNIDKASDGSWFATLKSQ